MRTYRVVIDAYPKKRFNELTVDADGEFTLSDLKTENLAGQPMVRIGEWLVSRDRIVAIVPEDAKERKRARSA